MAYKMTAEQLKKLTRTSDGYTTTHEIGKKGILRIEKNNQGYCIVTTDGEIHIYTQKNMEVIEEQ
jgi:hypothetical protein